jgi:hypothetical protein
VQYSGWIQKFWRTDLPISSGFNLNDGGNMVLGTIVSNSYTAKCSNPEKTLISNFTAVKNSNLGM